MGIGVSIFLIAVGAILDFAVDVNSNGVDLHAVGVILMVVGAIGLLCSLLFSMNRFEIIIRFRTPRPQVAAQRLSATRPGAQRRPRNMAPTIVSN